MFSLVTLTHLFTHSILTHTYHILHMFKAAFTQNIASFNTTERYLFPCFRPALRGEGSSPKDQSIRGSMTFSPWLRVPEHLPHSDMQIKTQRNQMSANLVLLKASFWRIFVLVLLKSQLRGCHDVAAKFCEGNNTRWHAIWKLWNTCHSVNLQQRTFGWSHSSYGMWMLDVNTECLEKKKTDKQAKCRDCTEHNDTIR